MVTRYSAIFPLSTFAFWLTISSPVIPRTVLRPGPALLGGIVETLLEDAVIFVTRATDIRTSLLKGSQDTPMSPSNPVL